MAAPQDPATAPNTPVSVAVPRAQDLHALVELTEALATEHDIHQILFAVVSRLAELVHVDRGSIVLVDDGQETATVVATSDDQEIRDLPIELGKYPELRQVMESGVPLVIHDVHRSPLLSDVLRDEGLEFASMALVPIVGEQGPLAVLALKGRTHVRFTEHDILQARAIANATAIALNNAKILGALRAESRQARDEDRKKLAQLSRYFDFFESSADAMAVMDRDGFLLFANLTLAKICGIEASELVGRPFSSLLHHRTERRVAALVAGFRAGEFPVAVDFPFIDSSGHERLWSVSFSGVLREGDAVLASMRDVTRERELAHELAQTKEFLERVIEASVDGIVSADLKGNILLFNRAACRLFGYEKAEVFGQINVEQLYPGGVARELMRKIRGKDHGGMGRLENYQVEMLARDGQCIPVSLSASFVMDGSRPVATLGIFTDIREKLEMESRLNAAQRELREHERHAAVAALAGAAAHELNQPLTSIMGYAEYLFRAIGSDPSLGRAVSVIQAEAERMADIVRKVGRITRFETKDYVGGAKIIDLDRASSTDELSDPKTGPDHL